MHNCPVHCAVILPSFFRKVILCPIQHKSGTFCPVFPPSDCCPQRKFHSLHNPILCHIQVQYPCALPQNLSSLQIRLAAPRLLIFTRIPRMFAQRIGSYFSSIFCGSKYCFFNIISSPVRHLFFPQCLSCLLHIVALFCLLRKHFSGK